MKTNYAAIFIAAIAYWLLGAVWYGVLFSKPWMALEKMTLEQAQSMNPVLPYVITFCSESPHRLHAHAQICIWRSTPTPPAEALPVGVLLWITGFVGPIHLHHLHVPKCAPRNSSPSTNSSRSPGSSSWAPSSVPGPKKNPPDSRGTGTLVCPERSRRACALGLLFSVNSVLFLCALCVKFFPLLPRNSILSPYHSTATQYIIESRHSQRGISA